MQMSNGNGQILFMSVTECNSGTTKKCPFGVNTTVELTNITTISNNIAVQWAMYLLTSVQVLSDIVVMFLISFLVLTTNSTFCVVPVLYSVSDVLGI
jgi:hypothetical protein